MERIVGIESARGKLGQLADEVSTGAEPVIFTKHGEAIAVLLGHGEYARLKDALAQKARSELKDLIKTVRDSVERAQLPMEVVDEAIKATRRERRARNAR